MKTKEVGNTALSPADSKIIFIRLKGNQIHLIPLTSFHRWIPKSEYLAFSPPQLLFIKKKGGHLAWQNRITIYYFEKIWFKKILSVLLSEANSRDS